jgi:hypothetical protein
MFIVILCTPPLVLLEALRSMLVFLFTGRLLNGRNLLFVRLMKWERKYNRPPERSQMPIINKVTIIHTSSSKAQHL